MDQKVWLNLPYLASMLRKRYLLVTMVTNNFQTTRTGSWPPCTRSTSRAETIFFLPPCVETTQVLKNVYLQGKSTFIVFSTFKQISENVENELYKGIRVFEAFEICDAANMYTTRFYTALIYHSLMVSLHVRTL